MPIMGISRRTGSPDGTAPGVGIFEYAEEIGTPVPATGSLRNDAGNFHASESGTVPVATFLLIWGERNK